jgi:glycosyltransferase involved in cell wall biosynthesis
MEKLLEALQSEYIIHVCAENQQHVQNLQKVATQNLHIHALRGGKGLFSTILSIFYLYRLIRKIRPILILTNTNRSALFSGILCRLETTHIPRLLFVRDFQWKHRELIWWLHRKAWILTPNEAVLDRPNYLPTWPTRVVPNFIEAPKNFDPKFNKNYFLCLAMISRWKGIEYLIQGFAIVHKTHPETRLVIAGKVIDQDYFEELQQLARDNSVSSNLDFIDYTNDIQSLYQNCIAVMNTSISEFGGPETFGRTIIEAWAFGKPALSFNCGGPKYIIDNGINGFLIPEKDVPALASKMVEVLQSPTLQETLGRNGHRKVQSIYNQETSVSALKQVISEATAK